jgi:Na+-transporting methylmalonyl-CoA/oxaloacetate decarboxylase gamma subunit
MDKFTNGFVLTVVGMGGTLLSLCFLILVVQLLKKMLPYREADEKGKKEVA